MKSNNVMLKIHLLHLKGSFNPSEQTLADKKKIRIKYIS